MLYEVITEPSLGLVAGSDALAGFTVQSPKIILHLTKVGKQPSGGFFHLEITFLVITSYSIHYTKLYDLGLDGVGSNHAAPVLRKRSFSSRYSSRVRLRITELSPPSLWT